MNVLRIGFLLLALLVTWGCNRSSSNSASPLAGSATPPTLKVVKPQQKSLPKFIDQPGTIQGYEETLLVAKLQGYIKKLYVDIGDLIEGPQVDESGKEIKPGTLLAELFIPELEDESRHKVALIKRYQAEVEQTKKQVAIAEASIDAAQAQVTEVRAGLKRAQANYDRWESENKRIEEMVRTKVVVSQVGDETRNQFRAAEGARDEALARITTAEKGLIKSQLELEKSKSDVLAMEAQLEVARTEADRLQSLLTYRFIRAPYTGVVTQRKIDTGAFVTPTENGMSPALFRVVRLDRVRVVIEVPEADSSLVHKGQDVSIKVPALKMEEFKGKIDRTSESLEKGARTLRVEIDLTNAERRFRPGMYVNARITSGMPTAWVLPANAVVKQADITVCFLYREGKAVRLAIQPGRSDGTFTEVLRKQVSESPGKWESLTGEEEILSGQTGGLTDGQEVTLTKESS